MPSVLILRLCIQCSFEWMMERAKRTNNLISFNVRMRHFLNFLFFCLGHWCCVCPFCSYTSSLLWTNTKWVKLRCFYYPTFKICYNASKEIFVWNWSSLNRTTSSGKCLLVQFSSTILFSSFTDQQTIPSWTTTNNNNTNWFYQKAVELAFTPCGLIFAPLISW